MNRSDLLATNLGFSKRESLVLFNPPVSNKINSKMVTVMTKLNVVRGLETPTSGRSKLSNNPVNITKARLRPTENKTI
jgi:hypothetical protein